MAMRHRHNPRQTRHAKLLTATHPRPCGYQHHLQGLLSTLPAGHLSVLLEAAQGGKLRFSNAATGSDTWTVDTGVWGAIASNTWSSTLRHGGRKGTANSVWSPWTPMTTSIVNAPIRLLLTLAHGSLRESSSRTPPSLRTKPYLLPPSSSCTKRLTDTE